MGSTDISIQVTLFLNLYVNSSARMVCFQQPCTALLKLYNSSTPLPALSVINNAEQETQLKTFLAQSFSAIADVARAWRGLF